jgi:hypothetical protein
MGMELRIKGGNRVLRTSLRVVPFVKQSETPGHHAHLATAPLAGIEAYERLGLVITIRGPDCCKAAGSRESAGATCTSRAP